MKSTVLSKTRLFSTKISLYCFVNLYNPFISYISSCRFLSFYTWWGFNVLGSRLRRLSIWLSFLFRFRSLLKRTLLDRVAVFLQLGDCGGTGLLGPVLGTLRSEHMNYRYWYVITLKSTTHRLLLLDLKDKQSIFNRKVFLFEDSLKKLIFKKMDLVVL